jgi:hypothetical protein
MKITYHLIVQNVPTAKEHIDQISQEFRIKGPSNSYMAHSTSFSTNDTDANISQAKHCRDDKDQLLLLSNTSTMQHH